MGSEVRTWATIVLVLEMDFLEFSKPLLCILWRTCRVGAEDPTLNNRCVCSRFIDIYNPEITRPHLSYAPFSGKCEGVWVVGRTCPWPLGFSIFLEYQQVRSQRTWEKLFPDLYTFGVKDFTYLFSTCYVFYMYNFIQLKMDFCLVGQIESFLRPVYQRSSKMTLSLTYR